MLETIQIQNCTSAHYILYTVTSWSLCASLGLQPQFKVLQATSPAHHLIFRHLRSHDLCLLTLPFLTGLVGLENLRGATDWETTGGDVSHRMQAILNAANLQYKMTSKVLLCYLNECQ